MKAGRPKALAAVGLAVGLLVVSACGGDGGPAAPAAPATTSAPTTGADTSAGPATEGRPVQTDLVGRIIAAILDVGPGD